MRSVHLRARLLLPLLLVAAFGLVGATAQSADAVTVTCSAKVTKLYKPGDSVIGVMKMTCSRPLKELRLLTIFARSGGGQPAKTVYNRYVYCYDTDTCTATVGVVDVPGKNKYWFTNDPQGTFASMYLKGSDMDCTHGIACSGRTDYF